MAINKEIRKKLPKGSIVFDNCSYDNAIVGVTLDDRVVYDFDKMVQELVNDNFVTDELEAIEWIEYNTIRALPYIDGNAPIIINNINDIEYFD